MVNSDETRELVKRLVRERIAERAGVQNIVYGGEEIYVSNVEDGPMRFNLPRLKKSYVVMSGRVYEREYVDDGGIRIEVGDQQPSIVTQFNYKGEPENVDTSVFSNKLICACGNIRYVKNADLFQVNKCKPCTIKGRNKRRKKKGSMIL
jgi:hypothetical protein